MNRDELIKALIDAGIEKYKPTTGKLSSLIDQIAADSAAQDRRIAALEERLKRRQKRQQTAKGRGKGRPAIYPNDTAYGEFWLWHPMRKFGTRWLSNVKVNREGLPLTDKERRHIEKVIVASTPEHVKVRRKAGRASPIMDAILGPGVDGEWPDDDSGYGS